MSNNSLISPELLFTFCGKLELYQINKIIDTLELEECYNLYESFLFHSHHHKKIKSITLEKMEKVIIDN